MEHTKPDGYKNLRSSECQNFKKEKKEEKTFFDPAVRCMLNISPPTEKNNYDKLLDSIKNIK